MFNYHFRYIFQIGEAPMNLVDQDNRGIGPLNVTGSLFSWRGYLIGQ
jgi:hypothetical protein